MSAQNFESHDLVHVGRDGWLFLTGGSNDVLGQYRAGAWLPGHFRSWRRLLEDRVRRARSVGARYLHIVVPEKVAVYDDMLIDLDVKPEHAPARILTRWLRSSIAWGSHIDLLDHFRAASDRHALYLKTDTHWSVPGCHRAYLRICRRMGVHPRVVLRMTADQPSPLAGDLGTKFETPVTELAERWSMLRTAERSYVNGYLNRIVVEQGEFGGGVGTRAVYRNTAPGIDPRCLVLCGDSYAHHTWLPQVGALTAMFAETFREVHFFWATTVDWSYVAALRPDFILTEIAERFMVTLPPANFQHAAFEKEMEQHRFGV